MRCGKEERENRYSGKGDMGDERWEGGSGRKGGGTLFFRLYSLGIQYIFTVVRDAINKNEQHKLVYVGHVKEKVSRDSLPLNFFSEAGRPFHGVNVVYHREFPFKF